MTHHTSDGFFLGHKYLVYRLLTCASYYAIILHHPQGCARRREVLLAETGSFDRAIGILATLKASSQLFIALNPPFSVSFEIERSLLLKNLLEAELSEGEFKREASRVGQLLQAVLEGRESRTVQLIAEAQDDEDDEQESSGEARAVVAGQLQSVRDVLFDDNLSRRYKLKRSSKAPSFSSIDWDIKVKQFDAQEESFEPFPYATCRISYQREYAEDPFTFFGGRSFESVQINFSADELDYFVSVIDSVRRKLRGLEKEV